MCLAEGSVNVAWDFQPILVSLVTHCCEMTSHSLSNFFVTLLKWYHKCSVQFEGKYWDSLSQKVWFQTVEVWDFLLVAESHLDISQYWRCLQSQNFEPIIQLLQAETGTQHSYACLGSSAGVPDHHQTELTRKGSHADLLAALLDWRLAAHR